MRTVPTPPLVACASLAVVAAVVPPEPASAQLRGGLVAGVGVSTLTGSTQTDFTPRAALGARLWVEREMRPGLAVGTGLVYSRRGAEGTTTVGALFPDDPSPDRPLRVRLDHTFLDIPLTVAVDGPSLGRWTTQAYAGPYVGLRQGAGIDYALEGQPYEGREADGSVQPTEWGLSGGLVGRIDASAFGDLIVGVHLSRGLTNVRTVEPAIHSLAALVSVGVGF